MYCNYEAIRNNAFFLHDEYMECTHFYNYVSFRFFRSCTILHFKYINVKLADIIRDVLTLTHRQIFYFLRNNNNNTR